MAFLKLNNITIPIEACSAQHTQIGGSGRALSGSYLTDVRSIKRTWRMTTPWLSQQQAMSIVGMLTGRGQLFTFDADSYSYSGFAAASEQGVTFNNGTTQIMGNTAADGDAVKRIYTAPSTVDNIAARTACLSSDSSSSNMLTSDESDMEGTPSTDWSKINGAETLSDDTTNYLQGSQSVNVVKTAAAGDYGIQISSIAVSASTGYTFQGGIKSNTASHLGPFRVRISDDVDTVGTITVFTLPSEAVWYRCWVTHTTSVGATVCKVWAYANNPATDVDFSVDVAQLEQSPYQTAWLDGGTSRANNGQIKYPESIINYLGTGPWTISFWADGSASATDGSADGYVFDFYETSTLNRLSFRFDASPTPGAVVFTIYDGAGVVTNTTRGVHTYGAWKHYAMVYNPEDLTLKLYINGALDSTQTLATAFDLADIASNEFAIGGAASTDTLPLNGQVDDFMVLPGAMDATAISELYNSGTAPTIAYPRMIATGDFAPDTNMTVRGAKVKHNNAHVNGANNYAKVDFTLEEV